MSLRCTVSYFYLGPLTSLPEVPCESVVNGDLVWDSPSLRLKCFMVAGYLRVTDIGPP